MTIDLTAITVAAIATVPSIISWLSLRASKRNAESIQAVHISINSRMDQLLKASKAESKAEGVIEGKAEAK